MTKTAEEQRSGRLEIVQAVVLAIATVCTAWCGYQAALWNGIQAIHFSEAAANRAEETRLSSRQGQWALADMLLFDRWLEADFTGNTEMARLYERRFRPGLRPAFEAWKKLDPAHNPEVSASPLMLPEYVPVFADQVHRLERAAERSFEDGKHANTTSDTYVQTTVLLALVLFFMGVAPQFRGFHVRIGMTAFGSVVLILAIVRIATLPVTSG